MKKPSPVKLKKLTDARKNRVTIVDGESYFRKDYKSFDNAKLSPNQRAILGYIYDTLKRSWNNGKGNDSYYDSKTNAYYAAIKRETLADVFNLSKDIISEILGELEFIGYIKRDYIRKPGNKYIIHIFALHFYPSQKSNTDSKNSTYDNQGNNNNVQSSHESQNSSQSSNNNDDSSQTNRESDNELNDNINNALNKMPDKKELSDEEQSQVLDDEVIGSNSLPKAATHNIHKATDLLYDNNTIPNPSGYKNKHKFIHSINGKIFGAKKRVSENTNLGDFLRWENNQDLCNKFSDEIFSKVYSAYTKSDVDNPDYYFFVSVKKFFEDITNEKLGQRNKSSKYSLNKNQGKKRIKEKFPYWERKDYKPDYKPISKERSRKLREKVKKINS